MKVLVLTTSYPRGPDDVAGVFVRDAVEHLRGAGVDVEVVSPASFRHYGLAYGHGIVGNLRRRPWLALALPLFLASYARAARKAARDVDLVHAHWLPSALPALKTREAVRRPALGDRRRARARERRGSSGGSCGAPGSSSRRRRYSPTPPWRSAPARCASCRRGVDLPETIARAGGAAARPLRRPAVRGEGRARAARGHGGHAARDRRRRAACGREVPEAVGFVPPSELGRYYERAAVVACPSHREGYGVVAREAMAHGRPVVATAVGGLLDAVEHEVDGPSRASARSRCAPVGARAPARRPRAARPSRRRGPDDVPSRGSPGRLRPRGRSAAYRAALGTRVS